MQLLERGGLRGVSVRSIAGALGLAPNALYHYFDNRQALEEAAASEVAAMLHAALVQACRGKRKEKAIRAIVAAYLSFARDHRLLYEVLVIPRPWSKYIGELALVSWEQRFRGPLPRAQP